MVEKKYTFVGVVVALIGFFCIMFIPVVREAFLYGLSEVRSNVSMLAGGSFFDENEISKDEKIVELQSEVASLLALKKENELLKSAIETKNSSGFVPLEAQVIGFDSLFLRDTIMVDVGKNQGVSVNQPAVYLGYLVGVVVEVSDESAWVRLLSDAESAVGVSIGNEVGSTGVLKSSYGNGLFVDLVPKVESIEIGQPVYSSAVGGLPAGLVVGNVAQVSEGELFHKIAIEYPIPLRRLEVVFILK